MIRLVAFLLLVTSVQMAAPPPGQNPPAAGLIELARRNPGSAEFRASLSKNFAESDLKAGKAVAGYGPDFLWAIESATRPELLVDAAAGPAMSQIPATDLWFALGQMKTGTSHSFFYTVQGARIGGRTDEIGRAHV